MIKKKANTQVIASVILLVTAVVFGLMLFNVGNRFVNSGKIYARYHLMETGYILETLLASPSVVKVDYNFDLSDYEFEFDAGSYNVLVGGLNSGSYYLTYDRKTAISLGPFSYFNFFLRSNNVKFSYLEVQQDQYLCPYIETKIDLPKILILILNNEDIYFNDLKNIYEEVKRINKKGEIYFQDLSNEEEFNLDIENNLSIIVNDIKDNIDIIIYYKNDLESLKFGCLLYNKINEIEFDFVDIALVPSNEIISNVQIDINFESPSIERNKVFIPQKIYDAIEVYFK